MDKKQMRYEIAKEVFPLAIENAQMVAAWASVGAWRHLTGGRSDD